MTAVAEWLMFELLRTPYRPPVDMSTWLGTEKYGLIAIMFGLAIVWLYFVMVNLTRTRLTLANYLVLMVVSAAVITFWGYIVFYPHRVVTPWHLLWT